MPLPSCICRFAFYTAATLPVIAQSNFDLDHSVITLPSIGAIEWAVPGSGAVVNQYYAAGFIYGANIGWISLGATPADRLRYRNDSNTDFGVNVTADGALRGYAYGANVGWINFEAAGNPRIDWTSGQLSGLAWAANLGWIDLENSSEQLRVESLPAAADSDQDGLEDAWEIAHAANLTSFSAGTDADMDGVTDVDEFAAGTDPLNSADRLAMNVSASPTASTLEWQTKPGYVYFLDERSALLQSAVWTAIDKIIGSGSAARVSIPNTGKHSFFRVRAYPPLSAP